MIFNKRLLFVASKSYTPQYHPPYSFRIEKVNDMFRMKNAVIIYTGNCIQLARSSYVLFPKFIDVNKAKPCKNFHRNSISVAEFYEKKSVVITGANGFIGTILVSKLLRSCPGLKNIYFLLREKNGSSIQTRMEELFKLPVSHYYEISTLRRRFP